MRQQHRLQTSQQPAWNQVLQRLQYEVIEPALKTAGIDRDNVDWTYMRWDAVDIEAAWPKDMPQRNVHAWLTGDWPNYTLNFEGAAWHDDEKNLKRHVLFFGGPVGLVRLDPPWDRPTVNIGPKTIDGKDLRREVEGLAKTVEEADPKGGKWEYDLTAVP